MKVQHTHLLSAFVASALAQSTSSPPVKSEDLQARITEEKLLGHAQALEDIAYSTPDRNRVMGSPGHQGTLDYLLEKLGQLDDYFDVKVQEFPVVFWQGSGRLAVGDKAMGEINAFRYSPPESVSGKLVHVKSNGCNSTDYSSDIEGNIALINRGTNLNASSCLTGERAINAIKAGAIGVVLYNDVTGRPVGSYPKPENNQVYVPAVGIQYEDAMAIVEEVESGKEVTVTIDIEATLEERITANVIAQTKDGDQENVVFVGAHSDSVIAGPGINDNGSGSTGILAVAEELSKYSVENAVRFAWWGGEEFGLLGSKYYVNTLPSEELAKIRLYLNFDMIASPNYFFGIYDGDGSGFGQSGPPGSDKAEAFFEEYYISVGQNSTPAAFSGRSDYGPFIPVGVPCGGLFTGAEAIKSEEEAELYGGEAGVAYDVNYHREGDNMSNLNTEAFVINSRAIAASVAKYGMDLSDIPVRDLADVEQKASERKRLRLPMIPDEDFHGACGGHDEL